MSWRNEWVADPGNPAGRIVEALARGLAVAFLGSAALVALARLGVWATYVELAAVALPFVILVDELFPGQRGGSG